MLNVTFCLIAKGHNIAAFHGSENHIWKLFSSYRFIKSPSIFYRRDLQLCRRNLLKRKLCIERKICFHDVIGQSHFGRLLVSALLCLHICICLQHAINQDSAYKQFTSTFALQFPQQLTLCHRVLWKRMDNDARKVKNNNSVGVVLENDLFSSQVTLFCTKIDVNYSVWRAF